MQLLDGRKVSQLILDEAAREVKALKENHITPKLVVILVGDNPASEVYVKRKEAACEQAGIVSEKILLRPEEVTTETLIDRVQALNGDTGVHGILVQLPLPEHVEAPKIIKAIDPKKDVDGFTAYNLGKMFLSTDYEDMAPCTPKGIIKLLEHYQIDVEGKEVTVVGASNVVGKPIATMLLNRGATVSICHIKTKDVAAHTSKADIVVVAVGKPGLIGADMVKEGAVVVDVGINRLKDGRIVGDCDFEAMKDKVSYISPVPGGVGPMTVACLIENVVRAATRLSLNH